MHLENTMLMSFANMSCSAPISSFLSMILFHFEGTQFTFTWCSPTAFLISPANAQMLAGKILTTSTLSLEYSYDTYKVMVHIGLAVC